MTGTKIGPYDVLGKLGAGGMGEVYRARDTKLNRDVAIKVLPELFAADPERLARFGREAQVLASLNHPNIAQVYGVEHRALVMELVEGEDLAERLSRGPVPLDETIPIARQIAEALEAAHERGIIHRDLKPANIKVREDGTVKVLDFGLAKAIETSTPDLKIGLTAVMNSPTFTSPAATKMGVILGTAAYMAPEQAKGKPVDKRADIWAFGCVLYEMLTGRRIFTGDTSSELLAAVIMTEPDLGGLSASTPQSIRQLIRRCLEKDPRQRLRDIGEARVALADGPIAPPAGGPHASGSSRRWLASGVAAIVAAVAGGYLIGRSAQPDGSPTLVPSFTQLTDQPGVERQPSMAPDGKSVVFVSNARGNDDLYLLRVGGRKSILLTEDSSDDDYAPSLSPDGKQIAFRSERAGGGIFIMEATGESVRRVADKGYDPRWSPDGKSLVVADELVGDPMSRALDSSLTIVAIADGATRTVARGDAVGARWSPNNRRIVYWGRRPAGQRDIWTVAVDGSQVDAPVPLTNDDAVDWSPTWSPDGRFIYFGSSRGGTMNLWRVAIDEASGQSRGAPEPVTTPSAWSGDFDFAADGRSLVFSDQDQRSAVWAVAFDPLAGKLAGAPRQVLQGRALNSIDLSPDGQTIVFSQRGQPWETLGLVRIDGSGWSRLTEDDFYHRLPSWSPDGSRILFYMNKDQQKLWTLRPDGSGLTEISVDFKGGVAYPVWSRDGQQIAYASDRDLVVVDLSVSPARVVQRFQQTPERRGMLPFSWSPDGRRLAGTTRYAARDELVILDLDSKGPRAVAPNGKSPVWLPDSRRVLYSGATHATLLDTQTGEQHSVMPLARSFDQWGRTLVLSRDARTLVYLQTQMEGDVWLMTLGNGPR